MSGMKPSLICAAMTCQHVRWGKGICQILTKLDDEWMQHDGGY